MLKTQQLYVNYIFIRNSYLKLSLFTNDYHQLQQIAY